MQEVSQARPAQPSADARVAIDDPPAVPSASGLEERALSPQQAQDPSAPGGGIGTPPSYVFALGKVEARFPSLAVEKEFAQSAGRAETAGLTDRQAFQRVLSNRQNRYLVRQLCWVLTIEGLETYMLIPRDPMDFDLLLEAIRPTPRSEDVDLIIGIRGPIAPPEACNGLM